MKRMCKNQSVRVMLVSLSLTALATPAARAQAALPGSLLANQGGAVQMVTVTPAQLDAMLNGTVQAVMAQAQASGATPEQLAQVQQQLQGALTQARSAVQAQGSGNLQVPAQMLQMLGTNAPQVAGAVAQGQGMQAQGLFDFLGPISGISIPQLPGFLGDGGMDSIMQYFINGLAQAVAMIPVIGPPLSEALKTIGNSILTTILNNELARTVLGVFNDYQAFADQINKILGMADLNKLLGAGQKEVQSRLSTYLQQYTNRFVPAGQTQAQQIQSAVEAASDANAEGMRHEFELMQNDSYEQLTGYSKYTNPLTATTEVSSILTKFQAGKWRQNAIKSTGQSLTAMAVGDEVLDATKGNVQKTIVQGQAARMGAQTATTTLGAMKTMIGLQAEANTINALSAQQVTAMLKQVMVSQDANLQATNTLVDQIVQDRIASAQAAQQEMEAAQNSAVEAAQSAAASVSSLQNITRVGVLTPVDHPLPGPYGEDSFFQ